MGEEGRRKKRKEENWKDKGVREKKVL
jgi:hypothetical protein